MVFKLPKLPCFEAFEVIFCPDLCSYVCLVCGGAGVTGVFLISKMLKSQIGTAAISNRSGLNSQSAREIAAKVTSKSVDKRDIATDFAVIRIAAIFHR